MNAPRALLGLLPLLCLAGTLAAEDPAPEPTAAPALAPPAPALAEKEAVEVVLRIKRAVRLDLALEQVAALRAAVTGAHTKVADALLGLLQPEGDPIVLEATLDLLAGQRAVAPRLLAPVVRWVDRAAERLDGLRKRGDPGFPVDPRSGEPALATAEGQAALARMAAEGRAAALGLRLVNALALERPRTIATWTAFLGHPHDELVVEALGLLARFEVREALPRLLDLYRCYPTPDTWETGAVVDLGGTDASAKRTWMVIFGHPDKQRARPEVFAALERALTALTGRAFPTPDALAVYLASPEPRRPSGRRR